MIVCITLTGRHRGGKAVARTTSCSAGVHDSNLRPHVPAPIRHLHRPLTALPFALFLAAACETTPAYQEGGARVQGIVYELRIAPVETARADSVTVTLSLTNTHGETVTLVASDACLAQLSVHRGGEWMEVEGAHRMCAQVLTRHEIPAGDTVRESWILATGPSGEGALPPGRYELRAQPNVREIDGEPVRFPQVERTLIIR